MTILTSYHRIVEKEPSRVNPRWKSWTVFSLLVIISSCFVVSFSLHGLIVDYRNHCFLDAHLVFLPKNNGNQSQDNVTVSDTVPSPTGLQYDIDEYWSTWGSTTYCETLTNLPLFQGIFGTVWLAIFLIHGPGGILPQPWRIVFPSLIFFLACMVMALAGASFITGGLAHICAEFQKLDQAKGLGCARLIVYFALENDNTTLVQIDKNYFLTLIFPWIWVGATVLGFCIILLRILLMVDFELLRVVISLHGDRKDIPKASLPDRSGSESSEF